MKLRLTRSVLLLLCIILWSGVPADASRPDFITEPGVSRMPGNVIEVDIIGDNRGMLPISGGWRHANAYVEAMQGERYSIRIRNNWYGRIALAISVDGRNIISGERSYNRPNESMYVLNPGQTSYFDGWRSSHSRVQRFYFTGDDDSYAGRIGDYSQIGWIKVAAFKERYYEPPRDYFKEASPAAGSKRMSEQAGTGYGEGRHSPVRTTSFEPENFAAQLVNIRYEWPQAPVKYRRHNYYDPADDNNRFTQPPPRRD